MRWDDSTTANAAAQPSATGSSALKVEIGIAADREEENQTADDNIRGGIFHDP